ncbi:HAD family hydrolase [Acidaminobacterium chupaoyuni]
MTNNLLFDFDGTLFDSMGIWDHLATDFLRLHGKTPPPDLESRVTSMNVGQVCLYFHEVLGLSPTPQELETQVFSLLEKRYAFEIMPKPGVPAFLKDCAAAHRSMNILTASRRQHVEAALRRCGLLGYFHRIDSCGAWNQTKDSPLVFQTAAKLLGCLPKELTVFEDAPHAAQSARAAGCVVYGIYDPAFSAQRALLEASCVACFTDFTEMRNLL